MYSMVSIDLVRRARQVHMLPIIGYVGWCILTYGWSDVPELSLLKLVALVLVLPAALLGGYSWVATRQIERGLDFLWPFAVFALFAWVFGHDDSAYVGGNVLQAGATGSPNFLGFILATSTPIVFLCLYRTWAVIRKRILWIIVLAAAIMALYESGSRASYLIFVPIACGFVAAINRKVFWVLFVSFTWIASIVLLAAPEFTESLIIRRIIKKQDPHEAVFYNPRTTMGGVL
jgi:hypothetical protein